MPSTLAEVSSALAAHEIVGLPFCPVNWVPSLLVDVVFESKGSVNLGEFFTPGEAKDQPSFSFVAEPEHTNATYTMLCIDHDAPSKTVTHYSPVRHYAKTGLKPASAPGEFVDLSGSTLSFWRGPGPPVKTGLHRYLFSLYRESKHVPGIADQPTVPDNELPGRLHFELEKFIAENGLELVGMNFLISANADQDEPPKL